MNTLPSKLTALAMAFCVNCLIMSTVAYLFEVQTHPQLSMISFARQLATLQWFV
jgi:hypothetical protein